MARLTLDCFDAFTARFIRAKARKLIGRAGFRESDREDLIQEFALDLLKRRKHFDPRVATWEAFVVVVCENCLVTILAHRLAAMRSPNREDGSLNCPLPGATGTCTEAGAIVPESQHCLRTCQRHLTDEAAFGVVHDVAHVLEQLPRQQRELCQRLMESSVSEVARETGVSRTELYRRIGHILQRFERAGLRAYL